MPLIEPTLKTPARTRRRYVKSHTVDSVGCDRLLTEFIQKEPLTCNDHRAVLTANMSKANLESTGIGAAACSRHGFFVPHTVVDFQAGEA